MDENHMGHAIVDRVPPAAQLRKIAAGVRAWPEWLRQAAGKQAGR